MAAEPIDRDAFESRWQANERELSRIRVMPGLDREMHAADAERLDGEQDAIEFELGKDGRDCSRRWSGLQ